MDRDRLTKEAACRLIRTQLRQRIYEKAGEIARKRSGEDRSLYDLALDSEKSIQAAAEASWLTTLSLWDVQTPGAREGLLSCISAGLTDAVALSGRFTVETQGDFSREEARQWIAEFHSSFRPDTLLREGACGSGT